MPQYRYHCESCGSEFSKFKTMAERHNVECECGAKPEIVIVKCATHFFPEGLWREMSYAGVNISSKRKLKEECYKRGLISPSFDIYPRNSGLEEESDERKSKSKKTEEAKKEEQSDTH